MPKKTCSICLENVSRPAKIINSCECKYYVHYKCINTWWMNNHNCIICHETCGKPLKYNQGTPKRRGKLIRTINRRRAPRRIYPPNTRYIHDYLNRIPFDNENELKTIIIAIIICALALILIYPLNTIPRIIVER